MLYVKEQINDAAIFDKYPYSSANLTKEPVYCETA